MRLLKLLPALAALALCSSAAAQRRADENPQFLRGSGLQLGAAHHREEEPRQALGQVLRDGGRALPGTPPMITALVNGELEIANLAYSTLGMAIQNAGIDDLRMISDEFRDGVTAISATNTSSARIPGSRRSRTSRARCSSPMRSAAASISP